MPYNPPLDRGGGILHLRSNVARAPPRPLNGITLSGMSNPAISLFQRQWRDRAARLGLDVAIPFCVTVDGHKIDVPVLLRQFGTRNGMLLVNRYETIRDYAERLVTIGYGYSCLSEPDLVQPEDDESLFEMLIDWSWSGEGPPPAWLTGHAG